MLASDPSPIRRGSAAGEPIAGIGVFSMLAGTTDPECCHIAYFLDQYIGEPRQIVLALWFSIRYGKDHAMSAEQRDDSKATPAEESPKNQGDKLAREVDAVVEKTPRDESNAKAENRGKP